MGSRSLARSRQTSQRCSTGRNKKNVALPFGKRGRNNKEEPRGLTSGVQ